MKESSACYGVEHIRTARSKNLRSIPRKPDDYGYLDLYTLDKERERLEKELSQLGKRAGRTSKRLEEIKLKMQDLKEKLENTRKREGAEETVIETNPKKNWKVISVDY